MKQILIATHNPAKLNEYRAVFKDLDLPFEIISLSEAGITQEAEENESTFQENAVYKVNFYSKLSDLPILAEDSGLEIDALNREPGVLSRRWPGHKASDQELIDLALRKLSGVDGSYRGAQFRVVCAFKDVSSKTIKLGEGVFRGIIADKIMAPIILGFPYRSIFFVPSLKNVLGSLSPDKEAKIATHRLDAIRTLFFS